MPYTKPSVLPAWAESGDKVQPTNAEIQTGWPLSSTPPARQRFNWALNYIAQAVRYLMQRGIPEWDTAEDYPQHARVQYGGEIYRAVIANTGVTPGTDPAKWLAGASASGVTPPQFDNDTSLATSEFVQRALGNRSGVTVLSANASLVATDAGKFFQCFGGTARAITLPPSAGLSPGVSIVFWSNATAPFTIYPQGADTISNGVTSPASVNISTGDSVEFVYKGGGSWLMLGALQLGSSSSMFGAVLGGNGYQKLPSGYIEAFGDGGGLAAGASVLVTLATTFPASALVALAGAGVASAADARIGVQIVSTSQIRIYNAGTAPAASTPYRVIGK